MSFKAYIDNVQDKTGKSADDFRKLARARGYMNSAVLKSDIKAGVVTDWLKKDFDLGHGHAMAIYALLKGSKRL